MSLFIQTHWMQMKHYGGWMLWSLDMDDFTGRFCGEGRFPLLRSLNLALGGIMYTSLSEDAIRPRPTAVGASSMPVDRYNRLDDDVLLVANDPRTNVTCTRTASDRIFAVKGDCRRYVRCIHGRKNLYTCRSGMRWSQDTMSCMEWNNFECDPQLVDIFK